jgi:invasion protein IalB
MRVYHWAAILGAGALLAGSAVAVVASRSGDTYVERPTAVKSDAGPGLIQESQIRQPPAAGTGTSPSQSQVRQPPAAGTGTSPSQSQVRQPPAAGTTPSMRTETITYDSWVVVCQDAVGGTTKKTCTASLRVTGQDKRQVLLNWQIGMNKDGHFVTAIHVPPAIAVKKDDKTVGGPLLVQNGVELKFGNGPARRINYVWCGPQQCLAEALIDDAFVKDALANTEATVTIYSEGVGAVPLDFSVKGIDKAISSTRK